MRYLCPQGHPLQMLSEGWPVWPEPCPHRGAWLSIFGQLCSSPASTSFLWSWHLLTEPRVPESQGPGGSGLRWTVVTKPGQRGLGGGKGRNNLPSTGGLVPSASQRGKGGGGEGLCASPHHHHICITKVGPKVPSGFVESPRPSLGDCSPAQVVLSLAATLADKSHIVG